MIVLMIRRFLIIIFWVAAIVLFLMAPRIVNRISDKKSLTIFSWPLLLDTAYLKKFEKETGIKLYITYFENGSSLVNKLIATKSNGYDLVIPDDHSLQLLIEKGLIKRIDKNKLHFWQTLEPALLGTYADRNNEYSIPYYWGIYGIGYNTHFFNAGTLSGWQSLFDSKYPVCMTDDPREAVFIASMYLYGSPAALKDSQAREEIKQLLIQQKRRVEVYTSSRADTLLQTNSCQLATIMSPEITRLRRETESIAMAIPDKSFMVIDSFAIPQATKKDELIYTFLNYLYQKKVIEHHVNLYGYLSPLRSAAPLDVSQYEFFSSVISDDEINELWVEVLAA